MDELVLLNGGNVEHNTPDITVSQSNPSTEVRFMVLEKLINKIAKDFYEARHNTEKNYPRIEVLVDTNCLVAYTGPMDTFDKGYFLDIIREMIDGRLAITEAELPLAKYQMELKSRDKMPPMEVI